jgi:hypothetical protein
MTKHLMAVLVATCLWAPHAAGKSSNVQETDRQGTKLEGYLPDPGPAVPGLNLESRTKLPKSDMPLSGMLTASGCWGSRRTGSNVQISPNEPSERRVP